MKQSMGNLTEIFLDKPVVIGDTWEKTKQMNIGIPTIMEKSWKLVDRKDGIAIIQAKSKVHTDPDTPQHLGIATFSYDMTGKQSGILLINEKTGRTVSGEAELEFAGTASAKRSRSSKAMMFPMSRKATTSFKSF